MPLLVVIYVTSLQDQLAFYLDRAPSLSELQSVWLDIEQNLLEASLVCAHYQRVFTALNSISEVLKIVEQINALELSFVLLDLNYLFEWVFDVEIERVFPKNSVSQLRKVKDIVDQKVQDLGRRHVDIDGLLMLPMDLGQLFPQFSMVLVVQIGFDDFFHFLVDLGLLNKLSMDRV